MHGFMEAIRSVVWHELLRSSVWFELFRSAVWCELHSLMKAFVCGPIVGVIFFVGLFCRGHKLVNACVHDRHLAGSGMWNYRDKVEVSNIKRRCLPARNVRWKPGVVSVSLSLVSLASCIPSSSGADLKTSSNNLNPDMLFYIMAISSVYGCLRMIFDIIMFAKCVLKAVFKARQIADTSTSLTAIPTSTMTEMEMAATASLQCRHRMTKMVYQFEGDAMFFVTPKGTKLHKAGCGHILTSATRSMMLCKDCNSITSVDA